MGKDQSHEKVVVVIVNWERPGDTIQCVESILESDYQNIEVILVDNGSQDNSVDQFRNKFNMLNIIELEDNLGFTGGYNAGIDSACKLGVDYIFILNNDTVVEKNTISRLVQAGWDISVPKITFYDSPTTIWAAGARWRPFPPTIKMIGYKKQDHPKYNLSQKIDYTTGCALLVKREVFEKVAGFDSRYINYMEDYDFSYRARENGFVIGYVPGAIVLHKVSRSLGESSPQRWRFLGRNTVLFYRHRSRFPIYTLWCVLGWICVREVIDGNAAQLPAFWDGVKEGLSVSREEA